MRRVEDWIEGRDGAVDAARSDREIAGVAALRYTGRQGRLTSAAGGGTRPKRISPIPMPTADPQLELPFLAEAGRSDLKGPTQAPPGRLRHVQLTARVIPYWLRRARRRTIGIVVDERGLAAAAPRWATIAEIEAFIREKERWVMKRLDEARKKRGRRSCGRRVRACPTSAARSRSPARSWARTRLAGERLEMLGARHSRARLRLRVRSCSSGSGARRSRSTASASPRSAHG